MKRYIIFFFKAIALPFALPFLYVKMLIRNKQEQWRTEAKEAYEMSRQGKESNEVKYELYHVKAS
jgi:hypothetical protein